MSSSALQPLVLIIEDDPAIRRLIAAALKDTEFRLLESNSALEGVSLAAKSKPELILLDLGLPDLDGLDVIHQVRQWSRIPILVLSAEGLEDRKVKALEAGADDYVTKPFGVAELLARMRVAWRRSQQIGQGGDEPVLQVGDVEIDQIARIVRRSGEEVHLTPLEYTLLVFLARHAGRVVTHQQILSAVWGEEYTEEAQYLRLYIGYLRKKLEADPSRPSLILTEPRVGYRILG